MVVTQASSARFDSVAGKMVRWVDQILSPGYQKYCPPGVWTPSINLYEDAGCYYMVVDLAGVESEQMGLHVQEQTLVLTGSRQTPHPAETSGPVSLHLMEIDHGQFCRTLNLPQDADLGAIEASYRNGYLWVRIPKRH